MTEDNKPNQRDINTSGGNYNEYIQGTYVQGNYYYGGNQDNFVEINFEELKSQFDNSPDVKTDLLSILEKERLLVLGGDTGVDKNELALHLAFLLAKKLNGSSNSGVSVKQWKRSSSLQIVDIELELRNTESPTIFVLTEIEPKNIGFYGLPQAHQTALSLKKHWVLASTDKSFSSWHLENEARRFFPILKYDIDALLNKIEEQLKKYNLQQELSDCLIINNQSLELVAQDLNNPKNVIHFVELFRQEVEKNRDNSEPTPINVNTLIALAKNDEKFIRRLYYQVLTPREQLLALGLSFFNGCFEDQLFAALEQVLLKAWRKRDPSLPALDYCDLDELKDNYFDFSQNDFYEITSSNFKVVDTKNYKIDIRSIKIISLENRRLLYKVAWESHRRQIINALEVLTDIVKESAVEANHFLSGKWELYGDPVRREKLYSVISQTISDIGLVSTSALSTVQGPLLRLATDENSKVRAVAASAIARWYSSGNKQQQELFRTLQTFYDIPLKKEDKLEELEENDWNIGAINEEIQLENKGNKQNSSKNVMDKIINFFNKIFKDFQSDEENEEKNYYLDKDAGVPDYIGATIAVAIGDVIYEYYGENELSKDFHKWLEELLESRLRFVHLYFAYYTLFWVVPLHIKEEAVRNLLKEIIQRHRGSLYPGSSFTHAIATSLAHAYAYPNNRQEVQDLLDYWYSEAVKNRHSEENRSKKITQEDALLKTVVLTYGLIKYDEKPPLQVDAVLRRLGEIFKKDNSSYVREAIVLAICNITYQYFNNKKTETQLQKKIETQLQDLLCHFKSEEQEEIVKMLTAIYLEQRVNIKGQEGEVYQRKIRVQERRYQLWKEPEKRPLTDIEKAMNRWVKLKNKATAQQIAIQALISFASALGTKAQYQ
ncbi:hypothetical protein H6G33_24945 [Calothrix sp. FACHB-1219]|uniref:hypothetical protein n=1 Tax=unclassified Calothrix TaxID=2619626 RepID=UPI001683E483|nr:MULTISPECIES: hypothetical protein [unclassified Calothrix]MBD2205594.1 hypothetical protein [Calothrix sp. FACHB-168]MBD2220257.1 hypothetical protein [Calothrix sp. FACHB-1219]